MKRVLVIFSILFLSSTLILFFQNCSKNQSISLKTVESLEVNDDTPTDEYDTLPSDPNQTLPPPVQYKSCLQNGVERPHLWTSWGLKNLPPSGNSSIETCDLFELNQCINGNINPLQIGDSNNKRCDVPTVSSSSDKLPCSVYGRTVPHGHVALLFNTPTASVGKNCLAQIRRCENGNFTGNPEYSYLTCMESNYKPASGTAIDCSWENLIIPDGAAIVLFKDYAPQANCEMKARRCLQGRLSGSFSQLSCYPNFKM